MALTLRTDDKLEEALDALTSAEGVSRQEVIRRAILDRYERTGHAERVEVSVEAAAERWSGLLDRLAET